MINLNKQKVTKEGLLQYINDIDVYRFYTGQDVVLRKSILSPLREEKKSSFAYFKGHSGEICFNDFVLGVGDFVKFVELKFGLTFFEALSKIAIDFNLDDKFYCKKMEKTLRGYNIKDLKPREQIIATANRRKLAVRTRKWAAHDLAFWQQFGITFKTLEFYNVYPIDYIFFDENPMLADKFAYVFKEYKDNKETIKIYQPYSKLYKWLNNHNDSIWQGWEQLPKSGEKLIITKSLKDVMSIYDVLNKTPSVALQSESVSPKEAIILDLQNRFKTLYLLYDNDYDKEINTGRLLGEKIVENLPIIQIEIPERFKSKDFSDLVKNYGTEEATSIYEGYVEMPF